MKVKYKIVLAKNSASVAPAADASNSQTAPIAPSNSTTENNLLSANISVRSKSTTPSPTLNNRSPLSRRTMASQDFGSTVYEAGGAKVNNKLLAMQANAGGSQKSKKIMCVLVFGPRGSGKTTLIKQARMCCGYRFTQEELLTARSLMRLCVFESVKCLWREIHRTNFHIHNTEMMELLQRALTNCSHLNGTIVPNSELVGAIGNFVYDYEVQNFIESNHLQHKIYSSTFDYAISHIGRILADDYIPSIVDIMHIDYMGKTDAKNSQGSLAQKQLLEMANSAQGHEKTMRAVEIALPSKHSILMMEITGDLTGKRYLLNQPEVFDSILYMFDVSQHGAMSTRDGVTKAVLMRNLENMQSQLSRLRLFSMKPLIIVVNKFDVLLKKVMSIPLDRSFPGHVGGPDPSAIKETIVRHIQTAFEGRPGIVHIFFANSLDSLDVLQPVIDIMLVGRWVSLIERVRRMTQSSQKSVNGKLQLKIHPGAAANAIRLEERVESEIAVQELDEVHG